VGIKSSFSFNRDEWQARGSPFYMTCKKARRGLDILAFVTSLRPSPLDYPINFGQREKTEKFYS